MNLGTNPAVNHAVKTFKKFNIISVINSNIKNLYEMELQKQKHAYLIKWLDYLKNTKGFTNSEVAVKLNVSQPSISQMKNGDRSITDNFINAFYSAFRIYNIEPFTPGTEAPKFYKDLSINEIESIADRLLNEIIALKGYINKNKDK